MSVMTNLIMKKKSVSRPAPARRGLLTRRSPATAGRRPVGEGGFLRLRILIGLFVVLAGILLTLVGFSAFSDAAAQGKGSPKVLARKILSPIYSSTRDLDEHGNRPSGIGLAPLSFGRGHSARISGGGAWSSLGPPGGDVYDAAASTVDPSIVLAGITPDGGFGGTLYRSSDNGNTWSEVPALNGTSVFDIEFAANGNAYIGTIDSVWESSDGGLTWTPDNLGIGVNDQVFDVALDSSDPSILWAGIGDASGSQPVNVVRSTDGGATWNDRTPPLAEPISCQGIAVDPSDSNTVIAVFGGAFGGGQVWVTTD